MLRREFGFSPTMGGGVSRDPKFVIYGRPLRTFQINVLLLFDRWWLMDVPLKKSGFFWALLEYLASKTPTPIVQDLEAEVWS